MVDVVKHLFNEWAASSRATSTIKASTRAEKLYALTIKLLPHISDEDLLPRVATCSYIRQTVDLLISIVYLLGFCVRYLWALDIKRSKKYSFSSWWLHCFSFWLSHEWEQNVLPTIYDRNGWRVDTQEEPQQKEKRGNKNDLETWY